MRRVRRPPWRRCLVAAIGLIAATATATASAAPAPSGFSDGEWTGGMVWDASVQFPDAYGSGDSTGAFTMKVTAGIPDGTFSFLAPNATGDTTEASADLTLEGNGTVGGSADEVVLVPLSMSVVGSVRVDGFAEPFPVNFTMGAGELTSVPLDIVNVGCSSASGVFTTRIAETSAIVAGAGGSLSVQQARWWANRVGEAGATAVDQNGAINQLVTDALVVANAIDSGTFDATALESLLRRAEEFSRGIVRNKVCEIETPGHFTTVIAGVVADILDRMANNEDLFDIYQFTAAILAGVQAGVIGASAGPGGDALSVKIANVLGSKLAAAAAGGNATDLFAIHIAALLMGDEQLAADALDEIGKL